MLSSGLNLVSVAVPFVVALFISVVVDFSVCSLLMCVEFTVVMTYSSKSRKYEADDSLV